MPSASERAPLLKCWVHSHEEDSGERMVLRPSEYPFPRARMARQAMALGENGEAEVEQPGPGDAATSTGNWTLEGRNLRIVTPDFSGEYELESVDEEVLVLRRLNPKGR